MLHGFDVSAFQSTAIRPCDFAFIKATEGRSYTSSTFRAQWASAKSHAKHRGGYHFARPEESTYGDQAARFLDIVQPVRGESVWLDLEASRLPQADTNAWARGWGDYMRAHAPGVTSGIYMGSGYASNGTGHGLNAHYDRWWYPQYPNAYQVKSAMQEEIQRLVNRTSYTPERTPVAAMTTGWPPALTPWLPSGLTCGWKRPDLWQFTDNWQGWDASVSALTVEQLAGGGQPTPEEDDMISGFITGGKGEKPPIGVGGKCTKLYLYWDNTRENADLGIVRADQAHFRLAPHVPGRKGATDADVKVGASLSDTGGRPDATVVSLPAGCDYIPVERLDDGGRVVGFYAI